MCDCKWRDIETAPKNEYVNLLLAWPAPGRLGIDVGHWSALHGRWRLGYEERSGAPTHWMTLPVPPVPQKGEEPK